MSIADLEGHLILIASYGLKTFDHFYFVNFLHEVALNVQ